MRVGAAASSPSLRRNLETRPSMDRSRPRRSRSRARYGRGRPRRDRGQLQGLAHGVVLLGSVGWGLAEGAHEQPGTLGRPAARRISAAPDRQSGQGRWVPVTTHREQRGRCGCRHPCPARPGCAGPSAGAGGRRRSGPPGRAWTSPRRTGPRTRPLSGPQVASAAGAAVVTIETPMPVSAAWAPCAARPCIPNRPARTTTRRHQAPRADRAARAVVRLSAAWRWVWVISRPSLGRRWAVASQVLGAQPQRVRDHADRRQRHRGGRDDGRQQHPEHG